MNNKLRQRMPLFMGCGHCGANPGPMPKARAHVLAAEMRVLVLIPHDYSCISYPDLCNVRGNEF